ncbi:MAG: hypothetical protein P8L40_09900 [Planktomarina sp.]|nr:hypothetical protein [Planktomarina sp.]
MIEVMAMNWTKPCDVNELCALKWRHNPAPPFDLETRSTDDGNLDQ